MSSAKVQYKTIDEYISTFPEAQQELLRTLRKVIQDEIPDAEEVISYQIPCFKSQGKYIIYFAGWKTHISLYPYTAEMVEHFKESADYKVSGKGTIQFPLDKLLPLPFIRRILMLE